MDARKPAWIKHHSVFSNNGMTYTHSEKNIVDSFEIKDSKTSSPHFNFTLTGNNQQSTVIKEELERNYILHAHVSQTLSADNRNRWVMSNVKDKIQFRRRNAEPEEVLGLLEVIAELEPNMNNNKEVKEEVIKTQLKFLGKGKRASGGEEVTEDSPSRSFRSALG